METVPTPSLIDGVGSGLMSDGVFGLLDGRIGFFSTLFTVELGDEVDVSFVEDFVWNGLTFAVGRRSDCEDPLVKSGRCVDDGAGGAEVGIIDAGEPS